MSNAAVIVDALLENEEIDPKQFVQRQTHRVYYSIVFLQSTPDALEYLEMIDEQGEQKAMELLADAHDWSEMGGEHEAHPVPSYGSADDVYTGDYNGHRYIMSYNRGLGYVGLDRIEDEFNQRD